jgi:hypothetical protein
VASLDLDKPKCAALLGAPVSGGNGGVKRLKAGAISYPQRFGGSLNLNVHYHVEPRARGFIHCRVPLQQSCSG